MFRGENQFLKAKAAQRRFILLVDDSEDALCYNKLILAHAGFEVSTARGGLEALELLSQQDRPDLILLDMQLGDVTGIEFLNKLEEKYPEIIESVPVVFLTGMDAVPHSKAKGFIRKSLDVEKFVEAVRRYMGIQEAPC